MAKQRNLKRAFSPTHRSSKENILVSGCSFTYNNSDEHVCSWPYYLKDLCNIKHVYDCSQSAAGSNHIFNSVIHEIESNPDINCNNTTVIIAWSGLTRTDVIADKELTQSYHAVSNYAFNDKFATLCIMNSFSIKDKHFIDEMSAYYKRVINTDAQILESALKIIALKNYLENKNFNFVFAQYQDLTDEIEILHTDIKYKLNNCFDELISIGSHSKEFEEDGHPTPDSYLNWTIHALIPYLLNKYPAFFQEI